MYVCGLTWLKPDLGNQSVINTGVHTRVLFPRSQHDSVVDAVLVPFLSFRQGEELDFGQLQLWCLASDSCGSSCGDSVLSRQLFGKFVLVEMFSDWLYDND